ncbi:hypothetical protein [Mycobacterium sp. E3305]|nr:hypothetical protein [Mycobacterium sp. E3305]
MTNPPPGPPPPEAISPSMTAPVANAAFGAIALASPNNTSGPRIALIPA